jgi:hypothetical protein
MLRSGLRMGMAWCVRSFHVLARLPNPINHRQPPARD